MSMAQSLDAALLAAHARDDRGSLVRLYARAADAAGAPDQTDRAAFFLTQAYIFALEGGDAAAPTLKARLVAMGRDI